MGKEKWSDAKTKRFISSYIKESSLWNVSDPDYASKPKKEKAYKNLQEEFNLKLNEVKNKIRIYRTTYGQELKKMENNNGVMPRLTWFNELHKAFNQGKIKSFTKTPSKKTKSDSVVENLFEIEYHDLPGGDTDDEKEEVCKKSEKIEPEHHQIIIEPFEEEYDEAEYQEECTGPSSLAKTLNGSNMNSSPASTSAAFTGTGMQSNELFLKSLQATLDKLPDAKNMRARIKIQEVLYKIAYDVDK